MCLLVSMYTRIGWVLGGKERRERGRKADILRRRGMGHRPRKGWKGLDDEELMALSRKTGFLAGRDVCS